LTPPASPRDGARAAVKLFVLDTNVLMHDPTSLFRFEEHDVYLPMVTLEELDDKIRAKQAEARAEGLTDEQRGAIRDRIQEIRRERADTELAISEAVEYAFGFIQARTAMRARR
jgi:predicted ribonuclease YlaK